MEDRTARVVEDDEDVRALIERVLTQAGFDVRVAGDAESALRAFGDREPGLVTLDLNLPGVDGLELCRRIRRTSGAYLLMLTGRSEEADRLTGLEAGADDYVTKPFSTRELRARVSALYRRPPRLVGLDRSLPEADVIDAGAGMEIHTSRREVRIEGAVVALTRTEFDLLHRLARHPGSVQDRATLVQEVWKGEATPGHLVDVHVANLRRKLRARAPRVEWIQTVRGVGYRFDRPL